MMAFENQKCVFFLCVFVFCEILSLSHLTLLMLEISLFAVDRGH